MGGDCFEERVSIAPGHQAEMFGYRFADVCESWSQADISAGNALGNSNHRNALACVVGSRPGRIVAVFGGQDNQAAELKSGKGFWKAFVERFKCCGIVWHFAAMDELGIEVDEICKDEVAIACVVHGAERLVEHCHVADSFADFADAAMGKDVADLANADDLATARCQTVEQPSLGWRSGVVAEFGCILKLSLVLDEEGACDDFSDLQWVDKAVDNLAQLVGPLQTEMRFMRGDLQDRIHRCAADRFSCPDMFFAEAFDDLDPTDVAVTQYARNVALGDYCFGERCREGKNGLLTKSCCS